MFKDYESSQKYPFNETPLQVDEVINCLRSRWGVTYDLQLLVRKKRLYLQIMWAFLEQQSFPMTEDAYRNHLNEIIEIINRSGQSNFVREWLATTGPKPRIGRALTLKLMEDERLKEFVL